MKSLIVGDKPTTVMRLAERLKQADSHAQYQRIQCVLIRATLGSSAAQIAQVLGLPRPRHPKADVAAQAAFKKIEPFRLRASPARPRWR
jgi:hypothetical protein